MPATALIIASSDDAEVRRAFQVGFEGRSARIVRFPAGERLHKLVRDSPPPALVFVDLDAAPAPGEEVSLLLRLLAPGTPLVAVVTDTGPALAVDLVRAGATDVLVKPFGAGAIRSILAALFHTSPGVERPMRAGRVVALTGTPGSGVSHMACALALCAVESAGSAIILSCDPLGPRFETRLPESSSLPWPRHRDRDSLVFSISSGVAFLERPAGAPLSRDFLESCVLGAANAAPALVLAAGSSTEPALRLDAFSCADVSILVVEPSLESVSCAAHHLGCLGTHVPVHCVLSHARSARGPLTPAQVSYALGDRPLLATVVHDSGLARRGLEAASRRWLGAVSELADIVGFTTL